MSRPDFDPQDPSWDASRRLLEQIPPEPHDSPETEQVWRRNVWTRLATPRRSRTPMWIAAASSVAALAVVLLVPRAPEPVRLQSAIGVVEARTESGEWRTTGPGDPIPAAPLRTDAHGRALVTVPGVAELMLQPGTTLSVETKDEQTRVAIATGGVVAHVSKRPHDRPFVVELRGVRVTVVGTIFSVSDGPNNRVLVSVSSGIVEVRDTADSTWLVMGGHSWNSAHPTAIFDDTITAGERNVVEKKSELIAAIPPVVSARAPVPIPAPVEIAPIQLPLPPRSHTATPVQSPQPVQMAQPTPAPGAVPVPAIQAPQPVQIVQITPVPPAQQPVAMAPVPVAPDSYADALKLESAGKTIDAAARLEQIVAQHEKKADIALYELGRLRATSFGDKRGALEAFLQYRATYPEGGLKQEVDIYVVEMELKLSDLDAALRELTRFLAIYPASERRGEFLLLRGNVLRQMGKYSDAIADYAQVPAGRFGDDALYYAAYCQQKVGNTRALNDALTEYLARYPAGAHHAEIQAASGGGK